MRIRFIDRSVLSFALVLILIGVAVVDSAWAETISGRVTNTTGTGLENIRVYVYDAYGGSTGYYETTISNGNYTLTRPPGNYKLYFFPQSNAGYYVAEWHYDTYISSEAKMITLPAGQNISNVNASLSSGGRIIGDITGPGGNLILSNVTVRAYKDDLSPAISRTTNTGSYNISVPAGTYRLQFDGGTTYLSEFYNDKKDMKTADPVTVTAGAPITRNAQLAVPQTLTISGCIRDGGAAGISGVVINGLTNNPTTDDNGCYIGTASFGWGCYSGRITPAKGNYTFSPAFKDYNCLSTAQTNQDYTGSTPSSIGYYDQFPGPLFDPQKWETNWEFVREIQNNQLVSKTAAYGSTVQNRLVFKNPETITYFEADVAVNEVDGNYGPIAPDMVAQPQAGLLGVYYNAGPGTPGSFENDVSAQVRIRPEQGQLISEWRVIKYTAIDGSAWTVLEENTLSSSLVRGQFYKLSINWDQDGKTFTFGDGVATQQHTVSDTLNPPQNVTRVLRSGVLIQDETHFVTEPALWGRVSATFDNAMARAGSTVVVNDGFSTTWIDANNWDSYEFVREIRNGELVSLTRNVNSTNALSNYLYLPSQDHVNEIQAKVTLAAYQNPNKAFARARLAGYFFNDSGDPNSGYEGETYAIVEIMGGSPSNPNPFAQWTVLRFNDPDGVMWKWTVHRSEIFPTVITPGQPHLLGLKWDGVRLAFKLDDYVDYYIPFTAIYPSNKKFMQFGTQIMPAADSTPPYDAYISATLDDVRIGVMNLLFLPLILKN